MYYFSSPCEPKLSNLWFWCQLVLSLWDTSLLYFRRARRGLSTRANHILKLTMLEKNVISTSLSKCHIKWKVTILLTSKKLCIMITINLRNGKMGLCPGSWRLNRIQTSELIRYLQSRKSSLKSEKKTFFFLSEMAEN